MDYIIISPWSKKLRNGVKRNPKDYTYWKELVKLLKKENYYIVQIGQEGEEKIEGVDEYLFDLPLDKIKDMLHVCYFFISVDNFLHHLGSLIGKKGIVLFGQSDPLIFGDKNNINILKDRSFLRQNQFDFWENEKYIPEVFVEPEKVMEEIKKIF